MASILNVDQIRNASGTTSATIKSDGTFYPTGGIVQVVSDSETSSTAMTSSYTDYLSVNITPKSSSSTMLVIANVATYHLTAASIGAMKLVRDSSNLNYEVGDYYHDSGGRLPAT